MPLRQVHYCWRVLVLQSLNCRFAQVGKARVENESIPVLHECFSHKYVICLVSESIDLPNLTTISLGQNAMEFDLHEGQSLTMNSQRCFDETNH